MPESNCRRALLSLLWAFSLSLPLSIGCGSGSGSQDGSSPETGRELVASAPDEAVQLFLEAVKRGDDTSAGLLLTPTARQTTHEVGMVVAPPGSDTASFQVAGVERLDDTTARVGSSWSDTAPDGQSQTDEIVWLVRKSEGRWRIAGMTAKVFGDRPPIELNFEDREALVRQRRMVEQEAVRRTSAPAEQARKPSDPFQSGPR